MPPKRESQKRNAPFDFLPCAKNRIACVLLHALDQTQPTPPRDIPVHAQQGRPEAQPLAWSHHADVAGCAALLAAIRAHCRRTPHHSATAQCAENRDCQHLWREHFRPPRSSFASAGFVPQGRCQWTSGTGLRRVCTCPQCPRCEERYPEYAVLAAAGPGRWETGCKMNLAAADRWR